MDEPLATRPATSRPVLIALLGALTAVGPMSIDMYLPALPEVAHDLAASPSLVQLTLAAMLIGMAAGQFVGGPVSDTYGRRRPMLAGLAIYIAGSVCCALAPSVATLVAARFLQGVASGFGAVIARAIVRDRYEGHEASRLFAALIMVMGVAPILAPMVGAAILHVTSWRGVFVLLAAMSGILLIAVASLLSETLAPAARQSGGVPATLRTFRLLAADRVFVGAALCNGFALAAMLAYISGSPFVLQNLYGASPMVYALLFGINATGILALAGLSARLSRTVKPIVLLRAGATQSALGGIVLLTSVIVGVGLAGVLIGLLLVVSSVGLVLPNGTAVALEEHGDHAGSASALIGGFQLVLGAAVAPLVGIAGEETAIPMAAIIAVLSIASLAALRGLLAMKRDCTATTTRAPSQGPRERERVVVGGRRQTHRSDPPATG